MLCHWHRRVYHRRGLNHDQCWGRSGSDHLAIMAFRGFLDGILYAYLAVRRLCLLSTGNSRNSVAGIWPSL
jgi:hypothetical protein